MAGKAGVEVSHVSRSPKWSQHRSPEPTRLDKMEENLASLKELFVKSIAKSFNAVSVPVQGSSKVVPSRSPFFAPESTASGSLFSAEPALVDMTRNTSEALYSGLHW